MKYYKLKPLLLLFLINVLCIHTSAGIKYKVERILELVEDIHFKHPGYSKEYAQKTMNDFIKRLDPISTYFYDKDVLFLKGLTDELYEYPSLISEVICDSAKQIFKRRLLEAETIIEDIAEEPFDFYINDSLIYGKEYTSSYVSDKKELIKRWRKIFKARLLFYMVALKEDNDRTTIKADSLLYNMDDNQDRLAAMFKQDIYNILEHPEGYSEFIENQYLKSLAECFDPHTTYFSDNENNQFEESLSKDYKGFGIQTTDNMLGQIVIENINIESSAWRSDELRKGDIILEVIPDDKDKIDLRNHSNTYLIDLLKLSELKSADFIVRKPDGSIKKVHLTKDKISSDNLVRTYILNGDRKIGYVHLPAFYKGCGADFQKEILKLNSENAEGLILDLSDNGGGSLWEISEIASCFLDSGKFAEVHSTVNGIFELKKINTSEYFNKPLVIIVNMSSASASELLTSILKYYNRALIVGTTTFGKATGQIVIPISYQNISPMGYLKVTVEKLFLKNGISNQLYGVQPHIKLPYAFDEDIYREKGYDNPLQPDTVIGDTTFIPPYKLNISKFKEQSKLRTDTNKMFKQIMTANNKTQQNDSSFLYIDLHIDSFLVSQNNYNPYANLFQIFEHYSSHDFKVSNTKFYDLENDKSNEEQKSNEIHKKSIQSNIYIEEGYFILNDLIENGKPQ